jgi:hypothetical protein
LKAFERSLADFLPIISIGSDIKVGIIDFIVKIVGGALTFVLLGVALRRNLKENIHVSYYRCKYSITQLSDQVMALTARIHEIESRQQLYTS